MCFNNISSKCYKNKDDYCNMNNTVYTNNKKINNKIMVTRGIGQAM